MCDASYVSWKYRHYRRYHVIFARTYKKKNKINIPGVIFNCCGTRSFSRNSWTHFLEHALHWAVLNMHSLIADFGLLEICTMQLGNTLNTNIGPLHNRSMQTLDHCTIAKCRHWTTAQSLNADIGPLHNRSIQTLNNLTIAQCR